MTSHSDRAGSVGLDDYAAFLPPHRRSTMVRPTSDSWEWREHGVHLLRARRPEAPARVLLVHGAGAHAEALWPVAAQLAPLGVDLTAVDLPCYGRTEAPRRSSVRYQDWIDLLVDLVDAEDDGRPLLLMGGSIGGLLAVEAAARSGKVQAVAATCLMDPTSRSSRARMTRWGRLALLGMPLLPLVRGLMARVPLRVSWVARLEAMGRDPQLGRLCAQDPRGGASLIPLGLMASYLTHPHQAARQCPVPVTLVHPACDAWTPLALSEATLSTLPGPTRRVLLREAGHFPLEEEGLRDLLTAVQQMFEEL